MSLSHNPFEIQPNAIAQLDPLRLVQLLNALLLNEGLRLGLPANKIKLTEAIYTPDGGIDLSVDTGPDESHRPMKSQYLDPGFTVVQYKTSWPGSTKLKKELRKPKVQEAFKLGANYMLIVGGSMTPEKQTANEDQLRAWAEEANCTGGVRLYVPDHLAHWASEVPVAQAAFRPEVQGYLRASHFLEREPRHHVPYKPDASRSALMEEVKQRLFGQSPVTTHIRIAGQAGVGKSRLALEIVRAVGEADLTLYSPNVPLSRELFARVASNARVHVTVIIDECDDEQALELERWARQCGGRLRLITVGVGSGTERDVFRLSSLDQSAMEQVVRTAAPTLPTEQVRWVAENTRGYVKLALLVAQHVAEGHKDVVAVRTDREIARFISTVIAPELERRQALQGVALLTNVGWAGEARDEGEAVARFLGLAWQRMQSLLQPLIKEGIVVPRGRYWYISPELLAVWLG